MRRVEEQGEIKGKEVKEEAKELPAWLYVFVTNALRAAQAAVQQLMLQHFGGEEQTCVKIHPNPVFGSM